MKLAIAFEAPASFVPAPREPVSAVAGHFPELAATPRALHSPVRPRRTKVRMRGAYHRDIGE